MFGSEINKFSSVNVTGAEQFSVTRWHDDFSHGRYLAIYDNEDLPNIIKNGLSLFKTLQKTKI